MVDHDYNHKAHSPRSAKHMATSQSGTPHNFFKNQFLFIFLSNQILPNAILLT